MNLFIFLIESTLNLLKKKYLFLVYFFLSTHSFAIDNFEAFQILKNSSVRINIMQNYATDDQELYAGGSGIVINKYRDNYIILTNAHVLLWQYCLTDAEDENCVNYEYDESLTIVIDTIDSTYEYRISYEDFIFWEDSDLAVIILDSTMYEDMDSFEPIEIGGTIHPLQEVYSAGFPLVLGNNREYREIFYDSCVINSMIYDEAGLIELTNYSIVHDCRVAGGSSGGILATKDGKLIGINGMKGDASFEQGILGQITDADFDNLNYAYAIHIYDLYTAVLTTKDSSYFNPQSKFYNFLPRLPIIEHQAYYDYCIEELSLSKRLLNRVFK